jgi:hypothetical protein
MITVEKANRLIELVTSMLAFRQLGECLIHAIEPDAVAEFIAGKIDELDVSAEDLRQVARVLEAVAYRKGGQ